VHARGSVGCVELEDPSEPSVLRDAQV